VKHYITRSLEGLLQNRKRMRYLYYEDYKVAANQLGFAVLMNNCIYPTSPHTLKKELIKLNKKYTNIATIIFYVQETYYKSEKRKEKLYSKKIHSLRIGAKNYMKKHFPAELKKIIKLEKIYKTLRKNPKTTSAAPSLSSMSAT